MGVQALHVGVKLILFRETRQWSAFLGWGISSLIYLVCYSGIAKLAGDGKHAARLRDQSSTSVAPL